MQLATFSVRFASADGLLQQLTSDYLANFSSAASSFNFNLAVSNWGGWAPGGGGGQQILEVVSPPGHPLGSAPE